MAGRTTCGVIRAYLREKTVGELIWIDWLASIRAGHPDEERNQRRWRRLVKEEWERRDALKAESSHGG